MSNQEGFIPSNPGYYPPQNPYQNVNPPNNPNQAAEGPGPAAGPNQPVFAQAVPAGYGAASAYGQPGYQAGYYAQPVYAEGVVVAVDAHGPEGRCCGCRNTCCNPYLHVMMLIMLSIAFVSTFVSLTGEMHYVTVTVTGTDTKTSFYRTYFESAGTKVNYDTLDSSVAISDCEGAGNALLPLMIVSIISLSVSIVFTVSRMFCGGKYSFFVKAGILTECCMIAASLLLFTIADVLWGLHCFKRTADWVDNTVTTYASYTLAATGYSYLDASTILILAALIHILVIRNNRFFTNYGRPTPIAVNNANNAAAAAAASADQNVYVPVAGY